MNLLFGVACGLAGAACWGTIDACATIAARRIGTLLVSLGMQIVALGPLAALFVLTGQPIPTDGPLVMQSILVGVISAAAYLLTYQAFRLGPVAVVSPVLSAYGGLSVVLAVALLGETLRPLQAAGVVVATVGVGLTGTVLGRDWRQTRLIGQGVPFAVVALVLWAINIVGLAGPIRQIGWLPTLLVARVASLAALLLVAVAANVLSRRASDARLVPDPSGLAPGSKWLVADPPPTALPSRPVRRPVDRTAVALVTAMGILDVLGSCVWSIGLEATAAWLVGIVGSFGPIITLTFGVVVLRERLRLNQWIGIAIVFSSIVLIGAP